MQRARVLFLALCILGTAWAAAVPPASSSLIARGPILILADAAFTAANGVINPAAAGTLADPFRIEGWHIKVAAGPAIRVEGTTKAFVVRANLLEGTGLTSVGVKLAETQSTPRVESNQFLYSGIGVHAVRSNSVVASNQLLAKTASASGIVAEASDLRILNNAIDAGAHGMVLDKWAATAVGNTITASTVGMRIDNAWWTDITTNVFDRVGTGLVVGQGHLNITSNTFRAVGTAVSATGTAQLNVVSNTVDGAQGDAVVATRATVDVRSNLVISALGKGVVLTDATGKVRLNTINRTKGAINLFGASVVHVTGNVMWNNEYGLSIPYSARASIPHLSGNTVNTVDIGFVYQWMVANVQVTGGLYDSNFAAGYYGGLTAEGAFVLYDVNTAVFKGVTIRHQVRGITAVNSFNVQVENSLLLNAKCSIVFEGTIGFVKNNTIVIPEDPPLTCGVDVKGGLAGIFNNTFRNFDVAIRIDATAKANITGNHIERNEVGVHVSGSVSQKNDAVVIIKNNVTKNDRGIVTAGFRGTIYLNNITFNTWWGVELGLASNPLIVQNNISANKHGVIDVYACVTIASQVCSSATLIQNRITANAVVGVRINGTALLIGNLVANNTFGADLRGGATLRGNVIVDNVEVGARVYGRADVRGDVALRNRIGFEFQGTLFTVVEANVSANFHGIVVTEVVVTPTVNFQPGPINIPMPRTRIDRDPLFVHLTTFERNRGDAIRATPYTFVNATYNWWGTPSGPRINVADQAGAFQNGITAGVIHVLPWWTDREMMTTGPVPGL